MKVVATVCLILITTQGLHLSFGVFFKPLSADFGWTRAVTSGAFSLCTILFGFLFIFTGRLNDRIGPRFVMTVCGLFLGLGFLLMSRINDIWQLYLFYGVVVAIGMSGSYIPLMSTVSRWFFRKRGLMTGIASAGVSLGTLFVPPIASWLIVEYGWRTSYVIVGIGAMLFTVLVAQFLRRDPAQMGQLPYGYEAERVESKSPELGGLSFREAVTTRQFWMVLMANLCFGICIFVIYVHIVPHATDVGISAAEAAIILAIAGASGIIGRVAMGSLADRIGSKQALAICFTLMSAVLSVLLVAQDAWVFYLFAMFFGIAHGGIAALSAPLVADLFGLRAHGVILGSSNFGATAGGAVGPVVAGSIFDVTGSYQLAFVLCIVLSVTGLVMVSFLKPAFVQPEG